MNNIFVLGPVASGKNTLLDKISNNFDVITLDTGRIFRYVAFVLSDKLKEDIDFNMISIDDKEEIEILKERIFHLNNYITTKLNTLSIDKDILYSNGLKIEIDDLYSRGTNLLLPIIAKNHTIRNKILGYIYNFIDSSTKPIIMSGHNIKEIDTSKFTVVFLDVNQQVSADRLYNRNSSSYDTIADAFSEVIKRNVTDGIENTKKIIPYLYNYIYIDTNDKSDDEIYNDFLTKLNILETNNNNYLQNQNKSIERNNFDWLLNPILEPIRDLLKKLAQPIVLKSPYINQNDLIYQTIILLTSHDICELYTCSDKMYLDYVLESIDNRDKAFCDKFMQLVDASIIKINYETVKSELISALAFLEELYADDNVKEIMANYNSNHSKDGLILHGGAINNPNDDQFASIEIRPLDSDMSQFISKYCHYLHTSRDDEFISYGAFKNNEEYPVAYVSFSKQDRGYKKQLLYNLGIEPQNSIEMTRAWCSNSAPTNIMSYLFQYSIDDITAKWKELKENGLTDKNLQAVTTTINPNLGFKASSFFGCNFVPIAMRPAKFTFVEKNGILRYETRRKIETLSDEETYMENIINVLPLNELILCLDRKKAEVVNSSNILLIDKNEYEKVLKNKSLVIKMEDK